MAASSGTAAPTPSASTSKLVVGSRNIICQDADLRGEITIGNGCILHPRCTIFAYAGPIIIGDCSIVEETAVIVNRRKEPLVVGSYNHFETGCRIESLSIGNYNTFEPKSRVPSSVTLGDYCVIGAGCTVAPEGSATSLDWSQISSPPLSSDVEEEEEATAKAIQQEDQGEAPEHLDSYTVVYGSKNERRTWSGEGKAQQVALFHKHLQYLTEMLPKYSRLKLIT